MERKEAIEVIKRNYPHVTESGSQFETALRLLIPELAGSGDERTWLINYLSNRILNSTIIAEKENLKKAIAWVEKQGKGINGNEREIPNSEQNLADISDKLKEEYRKGWDAAMRQLPKEVDSQIWQIANSSAKTWEESFAILCATQKAYDKGKKDALKEQNSTWSEEDEKFFKTALWHISYSVSNGKNTDEHCDTTDWLKSLKDRVQPQTTWKPSDEQMKALYNALSLAKNCGEEIAFDLRTLHEQLKKLREE